MSGVVVNVITSLIVKGIAKGATAIAQATVRAIDVDHNALDVAINGALPAGSNTIGKVDQGTGGASAWKVDGSAVTQPVSGTVTATISGTPAVTVTSGTVSANIGTAGSLALDATLTGGAQRAGILGADGSALASGANPLPVGPGTSTTWDVSSRVARLIGALTGRDGAAIASLTNGVPVAPETSSTWDVSSRAARLIGALTGVNGSGVATGANPVPMQLSSGATLYTGATAALSLPVAFAPSLNTTGATLPVNGVVIKSGAGVALWITITNTTGGSIYWQVFDRASGPPNAGERAAASAPAITANNGSRAGDLIGPTMGLGFTNGCLLVASSSPTTFTAIASTGVSYTFVYL